MRPISAGSRLVLAAIFACLLAGAAAAQDASPAYTPPPPPQKQAPDVEKHLKVFDTLDFDVFSNQKWDRLSESHAKDIVVTWPDGHETHGIEKHIEDLKALFSWAPDSRIHEHPVKFGQGEWTAAISIFEGTFTRPMAIGNGKEIPPSGKSFKLSVCTLGHWKGDVMDEEYLFWDNQEFMKQIGLGKVGSP